MEPDQYCREIETHLCRKNDGHLIRIVGPSFELVRGWAQRGIPLTIALHGIDRHFERYYAKGPRRRPVHIEFCEHDVLDAFDDWRRAVGVRGSIAAGVAEAPEDGYDDAVRRRPGLRGHIDRAIARLTTARAGGLDAGVDRAIERAVRELDGMRETARSVRGEARVRVLERLSALDGDLAAALREAAPAEVRQSIARTADEELAAFRQRMTDDSYGRALEIGIQRLLRERAGIPRLALD